MQTGFLGFDMHPRQHKYNARKVEYDGMMFDSKKEMQRYSELKLLETAGEISQLELQPSFEIVVNGQRICKYRADFRYIEFGRPIVEDVKGFKTPVYKLKAKLFKALYPEVNFKET